MSIFLSDKDHDVEPAAKRCLKVALGFFVIVIALVFVVQNVSLNIMECI